MPGHRHLGPRGILGLGRSWLGRRDRAEAVSLKIKWGAPRRPREHGSTRCVSGGPQEAQGTRQCPLRVAGVPGTHGARSQGLPGRHHSEPILVNAPCFL